MKIEFEKIIPSHENSSFQWNINPKLNNFFYWHFHPEYELVFIEIHEQEGTRHVGEHIARYEESDLTFIGSNIPHLNFDYGLQTEYEKVVLYVKEGFLKDTLQDTPELKGVYELFELSKHGITFGKNIKDVVGKRLKHLHELSSFEQFVEVLTLFKMLADSNDYRLLHEKPYDNQHNKREQERLKKIYSFIDEHYHHKIEIDEVASLTNLSKAPFCRYFKKMTKLTFTEFLNHYRVNQAKHLLLIDKNVSETCFECGFESLSYFNRIFKKITGENPLSFKKRHLSN